MEANLGWNRQFRERIPVAFSRVSFLPGNDSSTCLHIHLLDPQKLWKTL
jgi:hypothetical protein